MSNNILWSNMYILLDPTNDLLVATIYLRSFILPRGFGFVKTLVQDQYRKANVTGIQWGL